MKGIYQITDFLLEEMARTQLVMKDIIKVIIRQNTEPDYWNNFYMLKKKCRKSIQRSN